jgi:hypothetical protein
VENYSIELHRAESEPARFGQAVLAHASSDAGAASGWPDH